MIAKEINVTFSDGTVKSVPRGTSAVEVLKKVEGNLVAARINNRIESLSYTLDIHSTVAPVMLESREGTALYRQSLCFFLAKTSKELFPDRRLVIGHSLGKGFYYYYDGMNNVPEKDLVKLEKRMRELSREALPITREPISYIEAQEYFESTRQNDTALLLKYKNDTRVYVNCCGDYKDLYHAPLVPHTGILKTFELRNFTPGFLLRYFSFGKPGIIEPLTENPLLSSIYREYKNWGKILNMHCVGTLNEMIIRGKEREFITTADALHNKKIALIADRIKEREDQVKVILIAGPSSSGKTTFAKKLSIELRVLGLKPTPISIDNYFVDKVETPRDVDGHYDFESIEAIDVELLNTHLLRLFEGKETEIPIYDFKKGKKKEKGTVVKLEKGAILILEGIHCLNDALTPQIPREKKYKVYVSALTQLNIDDHNRISTTENRLVRRMVRDNQFRGNSAHDTLTMWPSVRRGEDKNIFPYQNSADSAFNSALDYELSVLKVYAEPILKTVKPEALVYNDARRVLKFLENFVPLPATYIPPSSILREFIGSGSFKY